MDAEISLSVNGTVRHLTVDTRTTLLDVLREHLAITGPKKGAITGSAARVRSSSTGAVRIAASRWPSRQGARLTTIEGLARGELHPLQAAFIAHDAFQCGYCTPGQICSAVGMLDEVERGWPSHVTADLDADTTPLDDDEIRERMSGNLCRCAAYANIVPAIAEVAGR